MAQQALGHNSKAVHHAYSKHAEVTVPSLDDWEREWALNVERRRQQTEMDGRRLTMPKLVPVDFQSAQIVARVSEAERESGKPGFIFIVMGSQR